MNQISTLNLSHNFQASIALCYNIVLYPSIQIVLYDTNSQSNCGHVRRCALPNFAALWGGGMLEARPCRVDSIASPIIYRTWGPLGGNGKRIRTQTSIIYIYIDNINMWYCRNVLEEVEFQWADWNVDPDEWGYLFGIFQVGPIIN